MTTKAEKALKDAQDELAAAKAAVAAVASDDQKAQSEAQARVDDAAKALADVEATVVVTPVAPAVEVVASNPDEFPTDWHREQYEADLERELDSAKLRKDSDTKANVERELSRVRGLGKQTRPRGAGKQTR